MNSPQICIRGAREHNLRDVTLELPRNKLICLTGVSGSGKSSLAFDTLYAEGQRRYIESLSAYARQFLGTLAKPDVDQITGLSPAVAIQQKSTGWNPRSTVGTVTGIYDFLRVLYARAGRQHCPQCGELITAQTSESIVARILTLPAGSRVLLLAPVVRGQKGEHVDLLDDLRRRGFVRARIDGQVCHLEQAPKLGRHNRHDIEVVIDRLTIDASVRSRLTESVEAALQVGDGTVVVAIVDDAAAGTGATTRDASESNGDTAAKGVGTAKSRRSRANKDIVLSSKYACPECGIGFEAPSPQLFSFNSPTGMCLECDGIGSVHDFDPELLIPDPSLPFYAPCVVPMRHRPGRWRRHIYEGVARHVGFDINQPWNKLPQKARDALLYGTGDAHITFEWRHSGGVWKHGDKFEGVIAELKSKYRQATAGFIRRYYEKFMRHRVCSACGGARLNPQARAVRVGGKSLHQVCSLSVRRAYEFFNSLELTPTEAVIAAEVLKEVRARLEFLVNVGLDYLTLDRTAPTLSGGESQRIRLAGQIGSGLVGVLYVLDEPSIGLHPRDNKQLLASLRRLRDMGNTVVVVEHDEETMREADMIVDFGPGPGVRGGHVVAAGTIHDIAQSEQSVTGAYLSGRREIEIPKQRRPVDVKTKPKGKKRRK
ncbi:MAG TPA: excinuclease ABC subunit UvrA [Phycisphaerae bacterium]|nr:excinuclease ABC subunit UvrA [Phycisphaerae bacterium]HOJ73140.1 excinuclease ABC subunit UvrA [Phycisphaerae bacterium]HOM52207.1 excinuclease ABC subunit UvrA [Phycisphaerae bacterium]HOQ85222.1 excinuclease ABC subunit UvrA [Phycisphaerae bacterium]HPP25422.1 excinuclease ABC subunit UvrA [Phycisphaerae bacterium]